MSTLKLEHISNISSQGNDLSIDTNGNITTIANIKADGGNLILGDEALSVDANYVGLKTSYMTGTADYMILSGTTANSIGDTFVSAKSGSNVFIRGGGNDPTHQIEIQSGQAKAHGILSVISTALVGNADFGSYNSTHGNLMVSNGANPTSILLYNDAGAYNSSLIQYDTNVLKLGLNNSNSANTLLTTSAINVNATGVGIGIEPASTFHINMGTDKNIQYSGGIGEIGSVPGFQATNDASSGLRSMGMRGTSLRFATGSAERLRIEDNAVGIGTDSPSTTDSGYNEGALHVHNATGSGSQVRWTNSTTGTGTSDGFMISKWSDKNTYITNFDDGANTVFTQSNSSGTLVTTMTIDGDGNVGIGSVPESTVKLEVNAGADGAVAISGRSDGGNGNNRRFNLIPYADGGGANYGGGLKIQTRDSVNVFHDRITVQSNGYVGINTTSPQRALHIHDHAATGLHITNTQSGSGANDGFSQYIRDDNQATELMVRENSYLGFGTNNTLRAKILSSGEFFWPEISNRGDLTFPICSISNAGAGNQYLHVQFQANGGDMLHIHFRGYEYIGSSMREGSGGGYIYNTGGQNAIYAEAKSGHCYSVYQTTTNRVELVIDTGVGQTSNRWGSYVFFGGTDTITSDSPLTLVQYGWNNSSGRLYSS